MGRSPVSAGRAEISHRFQNRNRRNPQTVTSFMASTTIPVPIFEVPLVRSRKMMGTSTMARPSLVGSPGHLDLKAVAGGLGGPVRERRRSASERKARKPAVASRIGIPSMRRA